MNQYQAEPVDYLKSRYRHRQFSKKEVVVAAVYLVLNKQLSTKALKEALLTVFNGNAVILLEALEEAEQEIKSELSIYQNLIIVEIQSHFQIK
jgi:hypothetical protein